MSVYRYYLPKTAAKDVTDDTLAALGLAERLRDCTLKRHRGNRIEVTDFMNHGPDGSSGALVTPQPADRKGVPTLREGTYEAHQSQHGGYWIVWEKSNPPTPEGLQRWETVPGVWCELGDGRIWQCPTVQRIGKVPRVPLSYSRLNGALRAAVMPDYLEAWKLSSLWSVRLLPENREARIVDLLGADVGFDSCVKFLSLNYRISAEEAALIDEHFMNDASMASIIDAAVDMAFLMDAPDDEKKTAALNEVSEGLRSFLRGLEESTLDTNQPEPISTS